MTLQAGGIIFASDINNIAGVTYTKANVTARASTTTLANDLDLTAIALGVGTYDIELVLFYTVASTTPKLKTRWAFTGTWATTLRACFGPGNVTTPANAPDLSAETAIIAHTTDTQDSLYNSTTSGNFSAVRELARGIVVTGAGNLSLQWAQSTSNASAVSVQAGSSFSIRQTA